MTNLELILLENFINNMNQTQTNKLRQMLASLRIEKQDLQAQKVELNETHNSTITAINDRIAVINQEILSIKEGIE